MTNYLNTKQLLQFWLLMLSSLCAVPSIAANLSASVDRDTLGLEETLVLNLRYDEQINATPDYDLLRKDFDILNVQSGTQMSIINGSMEASTQWTLSLAPKKIGTALIPSFNINGAVSDAIEITVEGKSRNQTSNDENITLVTELDQHSSHVQQQLLLTVRLYSKVSLAGIELEPLELKNAIVVKLDDKQYQTQVHGQAAIAIESRFAVYPQQSGELLIPSLLYQVAVDNDTRDIFGRSNSKILRYRTDEQRIDVKPARSAAGEPWLPAKNLTLTEHWNLDIDDLKVGEPVSRTITIKADGLTAAQITPLPSPQVKNLTFYKDQAQNDDQKNDAGVVGTRIETLAIVPTQAGKFVLPEVKVKWWNTQSQEFEIASLPAVSLTVASSAMSASNLQTTPAATEPIEPVPLTTDLNSLNPQQPITTEAPYWLYATNLICFIGLLFFALKAWQLQRSLKSISATKAAITAAHIHKESDAWQKLKATIALQQAAQIRVELLHWAQLHWPKQQLLSLQDLIQHLDDPKLTQVLTQLDQAAYSSHAAPLDTSELLQLLSNLRRSKNKGAASPNELRPLYKN